MILRSDAGSTVRLKDVGTVVDDEERTTTTRLDGADAVSFAVRKQSGANTVEITDRVAAVIARIHSARCPISGSTPSTTTPTSSRRTSTFAATSCSAASSPYW